jgi:hypothetical protein
MTERALFMSYLLSSGAIIPIATSRKKARMNARTRQFILNPREPGPDTPRFKGTSKTPSHRHSRESGNLEGTEFKSVFKIWIPAFKGRTDYLEAPLRKFLSVPRAVPDALPVVRVTISVSYWIRDRASERSIEAPSPRQALPCMRARVRGSSRARRSSVAAVFGPWL